MTARINVQILPFRLYPAFQLMASSTSYNEAARMHREGRIDDAQWRWYRFFWTWSAYRMSDVENASVKQHRCAKSIGHAGLQKRFDRVMRLRDALVRSWFGAYMDSH